MPDISRESSRSDTESCEERNESESERGSRSCSYSQIVQQTIHVNQSRLDCCPASKFPSKLNIFHSSLAGNPTLNLFHTYNPRLPSSNVMPLSSFPNFIDWFISHVDFKQ
jgi:hypothetical protein